MSQPEAASPPSKASIERARKKITAWFEDRGQRPFAFQKRTWSSYLSGEHGLLHSPTGTGKTLAVFLGPVIEALAELESAKEMTRRPPRKSSQLRILWITPLRALAADTETNLAAACKELELPWYIEKRTGDTKSAVRARQRKSLPEVLITTPESLSLMLTHADVVERFRMLRAIIVDEWHELLGTKRGVQTEVGLARVRRLQPAARIWGLSATLGNMEEAANTLLGRDTQPQQVILSKSKKKIKLEAAIPDDLDRFPWAGHLGSSMAAGVADIVRSAQSSLVFTNTRAQSEHWYRLLLRIAPELAGQMAVHHGSLDQQLRWWIEEQLRLGKLKCCVCTSSLDLGVDFSSVERVVQIGSPKGAARLLQRAGRSGHQPEATSHVTFIPTNALELVEFSALQQAIADRDIESRHPMRKPLDVLAQHVVTIAVGGGFKEKELLDEIRTTEAYRELSHQEWQWVLDFCQHGSDSLRAYPDYQRISRHEDYFFVDDPKIIKRHRMSIGTIASDAAMAVKFLKGRSIGTVEETFIAKLSPGDKFMLGGKLLKLVRVHDNVAWVRKATGAATAIPRWSGGRMPLSTELAQHLREKIEAARGGEYSSREMRAVRPILELQDTWSCLPTRDELLIERLKTREGNHLFVYPFDGRLVHEGLAALFAVRLSRVREISFAMAMNDYGFVLVSKDEIPLDASIRSGLLSQKNIGSDILSSLNASEMSKRQFREIARVAGLVFSGYPGARNSNKQLQASSSLFYDVFEKYDPENLLLFQSREEVLQQQLQQTRLLAAMQRIESCRIVTMDLQRPSPLAFGLIADKLRDRVSSESFDKRIRKMLATLEKQADKQLAVS